MHGLSFFSGLKRPKDFKVGGESVKVGRAGSALLTDVKSEGSSVTAELPFAESGLLSYSGLKLALETSVEDTADGLVITATNPEKLETKLLSLDVVPANKLSFKITAKKSADGVDVTVEESVTILHQEAKVGKLLGAAVAVADGLDAEFPGRPVRVGLPLPPPHL